VPNFYGGSALDRFERTPSEFSGSPLETAAVFSAGSLQPNQLRFYLFHLQFTLFFFISFSFACFFPHMFLQILSFFGTNKSASHRPHFLSHSSGAVFAQSHDFSSFLVPVLLFHPVILFIFSVSCFRFLLSICIDTDAVNAIEKRMREGERNERRE
jgi:hypothetical protein